MLLEILKKVASFSGGGMYVLSPFEELIFITDLNFIGNIAKREGGGAVCQLYRSRGDPRKLHQVHQQFSTNMWRCDLDLCSELTSGA